MLGRDNDMDAAKASKIMRGIEVGKKRKKAKKVYRKMYQTYVFMLCVPILFSIAFYYYAYGEISSSTQTYTGNLNNTIKNIYDTKIQYYEGITNQLKINEEIAKMLKNENFETSQSYWNFYVVRNTLQDLKISMQESGLECESVFVYLLEENKVIYDQTAGKFHYFNDMIMGLGEQEALALQDCMQNLKKKTIFSCTNQEGTPYFVVMQPAVDSKGKTGKAVLGVVIDMNRIEIEEQTDDWQGGIEWMILDENSNVVRVPRKWQETGLYPEGLALENGQQTVIDGEKYLVSIAESEVCGWNYVLLTPSTLINSSTNRIRLIYLLCVGVSLVVGYCLLRKAMRVTYNPLEKMLNSLQRSNTDEPDADENEFEYLNKQISMLVEKDAFTSSYAKKAQKDIRAFTVEKLITGGRISGERCDTDVLKKFDQKYNVVLVFMQQEISEDRKTENHTENESLKSFIISNVAEECIRKHFEMEMYSFEDGLLALVQLTGDGSEERKLLSGLVEEAYDFVYKNFQLKFYTLEGGVHFGLEGIHQSYLEACLSEKIAFMLNEPYVRYDEIKDNSTHKYRYSFEMEEMLRSAIDSNKGELAVSIVESLLNDSFAPEALDSMQVRKCLLYDIFSTLWKASSEAGIKFDKVYEFENTILRSDKETVQKYFTDIIENICKKESEISGASQKNALCENVNAYIEAHFTDPELNISQMALEFSISPSYLSAQYKKNTGESILDVIKNRRVEYAKQLLSEDLSVADVAVQCGFRESATFVRVFKKCTGITPGQLKKIDKN